MDIFGDMLKSAPPSTTGLGGLLGNSGLGGGLSNWQNMQLQQAANFQRDEERLHRAYEALGWSCPSVKESKTAPVCFIDALRNEIDEWLKL